MMIIAFLLFAVWGTVWKTRISAKRHDHSTATTITFVKTRDFLAKAVKKVLWKYFTCFYC